MSWGLRVRAADGTIDLDTSTYTSRWLSTVLTESAQAGFYDAPVVGAQKPMIAVLNACDRAPDISFSGNRISYQTYGLCRLFFGVR